MKLFSKRLELFDMRKTILRKKFEKEERWRKVKYKKLNRPETIVNHQVPKKMLVQLVK